MTAMSNQILSTQAVEHYQREGYWIHDQAVLQQSQFDALKNTFEGILDESMRDDVRPEAIDVPHFLYPELLKYALSDEVLRLMQPLLGDDIGLFSTHFICKPSGNGKRVPWHEDSAYWRGKIDPMSVATVWLAIDPSHKENGCMKVIPRTHNTGRAGFSDYEGVDTAMNVFDSEILKTQRADELAKYIELEPNQCSLHDARIMHGSDANTSNLRRCGWTMRFFPLTSKYAFEKFGDTHHVYHARGMDRAGNVFADPTKAYPELVTYRRQHIKNSH
jgi:hypothetical protein